MGMHQVRNARGESLYQGRPTTGRKQMSDQNTDVRGGADPVTDDQLHAPIKTRPFATYPFTPAPPADQVSFGVEGPTVGNEQPASPTNRKGQGKQRK